MKTRVLSALLTAVMAMGLLMTPAFAAKNNTKATTLRLEETTGTVTVKNSTGKTVKTSSGSKLYSGYSVETGKASYAWVSLDDDVVIKTDANTTITVKQSGKKLEVQLKNGRLFFNVSKPIAKDSSLNIRTSNMSTGIRGTSGTVGVTQRTVNREVAGSQTAVVATETYSQLVVYDGTVTMTYIETKESSGEVPGEPAAEKETVTVSVTAGQQAKVDTVTVPELPGEEPPAESTVTTAEIQDVAVEEVIAGTGFAAVEVAGDGELKDRIAQANTMEAEALDLITEEAAEETLKEEQKAAEAEAEKQQEAVSEAAAEVSKAQSELTRTEKPVDQVFKDAGEETFIPVPPAQYTVSYFAVLQFDDVTGKGIVEPFATQTVTAGQKATAPLLTPGDPNSGYVWATYTGGELTVNSELTAYNFDEPVRDNVNLVWVAVPQG
ncbi:MAG: FecR domain-containing protein [Oscillospiraceae bacterium]|nr:FecR domain-containing protein [Oscillospiraceae bacterium]